MNAAMNLRIFIKAGNFLTSFATMSFSRTALHEVRLLKENDGQLGIENYTFVSLFSLGYYRDNFQQLFENFLACSYSRYKFINLTTLVPLVAMCEHPWVRTSRPHISFDATKPE
jgi:hypothetical protein